jgi:hypothetical protein
MDEVADVVDGGSVAFVSSVLALESSTTVPTDELVTVADSAVMVECSTNRPAFQM